MATRHAKCSASASHRWLNCTAAPNFEAGFPDGGHSKAADEGTLAHKICEILVDYNAGELTKRRYNSQLKKCQENELYSDEMLKHAEGYAAYIYEKATAFPTKPYQQQEVEVDFSDYVPEGFGTCDSLMIGDNHIQITDFKYGKGVPVSAANNPQMRLYALGAIHKYGMFYDIRSITMAIYQPRVYDEPQEETITREELEAWGEQIKPIAQKAFTGEGAEFHEGPWCMFCKGKDVCTARAVNMTALEDFMDLPIEGKLSESEQIARKSFSAPMLSDDDVGDLLIRGERLVEWYKGLQDYALGAILAGKTIPGWKCVEGRSQRAWDDAEAALEIIKAAGYDETMLYERKPKSLAELEKMLGKKQFAEICGAHVIKPAGKPTLAAQSDTRDPFSPAAADFKDVVRT